MTTKETVWISDNELSGLFEGRPHELEGKLRSLEGQSREPLVRQRARTLGGGGTGLQVTATGLQMLLDSGSLVLKPEPQSPSKYLKNPQAFLDQYGLKRPEPKST